jgi:hypothetical protein
MSDVSNTLIDVSNEIQYVDGMIITENLIAIDATGGFTIDISLADIDLLTDNPIRDFDLTETLQLEFDVRIFNEKIGLIKDASNITILDSSFNSELNVFPNDSFTLTFEEFKDNLDSSQVISLGKFETIYSDFKQYINHCFYYNNLFPSLLKSSDATDISNGIFDSDQFIELINGQYVNEDGETVDNFSGSVKLDNINISLSYILQADPFENRVVSSDLSYSKSDGFISGDLILVNPGMIIELKLIVDQQSFITDPCYNLFTLSTTTEAPILLRLENLS